MCEHVTQDMMSELVQDQVCIYRQDWFSQLEVDMNGDAKVMNKHVGCGG